MKLIIYDFDDTLFPSYPYVKHLLNYDLIFKDIDDQIYLLLSYSLTLADDVIILSDGDTNWINSILDHLPKTKVLIDKRIKIVSTIIFYADLYRANLPHYKYNYINNEIDLKRYDMIINVGDGVHEEYASYKLQYRYPIRHVKFLYQPSYEEWLDEMSIIQDVLKDITDKKINYYSFLQRPIDTFGILKCQYSIN